MIRAFKSSQFSNFLRRCRRKLLPRINQPKPVSHQCDFCKIKDDYNFTQDWVETRPVYWLKHLKKLANKPGLYFLEIGCFEGRSTVWFLKNILTHPTARIDCLDIFDGHYKSPAESYEQRFNHNIRHSGAAEKVTKWIGDSQKSLRKLSDLSYDCIYIDGSHTAVDVLQDTVLSFPLLKSGGILIFDDYEWEVEEDPLLKPKIAIDAFLRIYEGKYQLLEKNYQVMIEKI